MYIKLGWNGGKTLHDLILRYEEEREAFRLRNNLSVAQVNTLLKNPERLVDTVFTNDSTGRFVSLVDNGQLGRVELLNQKELAPAVTKRVAKKSK